MRVCVHPFESPRLYPSVRLGRGNAGMSEQLLDGPQICATFKQMGSKRVAQGMRRDPLGHSGLLSPHAQPPAYVGRRQATAALRDEHGGLYPGAVAGKRGTAAIQVGLER